jgi:glutamate transport system permease protein
MSNLLFDTPGRRARRRVLIASALSVVGLAALVYMTVRRLANQGQLGAEKWSPVFNPADEQFALLWRFLAVGLLNTLRAASVAVVLSVALGTALAVARISAARSYGWLIVTAVEILRGVPVVIAIFFAARVLPELGLELPLMWYLVIGLTVYNSVVIGEIVRAGVGALPRGQTEAAEALGLSRGQTLGLVLLPQAFRIMLPALISQLVVVLKDTSLGAFISYEELLRRGNIAVQSLQNPLQLFLVIALLFIAVNYALGQLAARVERRVSQSAAFQD